MHFLDVWLPIGLVLLGFVLLILAYYFRRKAETLRKTLFNLYALNQLVNQDALDYFEQAWSILKQAGVVEIQAEIYWFGERQNKVFTSNKKRGEKKLFQVEVDDMSFNMVVFYPRYLAEESGWINLIMTTFVKILEQDLEHKHAEILTSQKRLERYQLFVQHEIKNIAQFIQLLSEQVVSLQVDQDKIKLMNRLQNTLPLMSERAKNTLQKMQQPLYEFYVSDAVALNSVIAEVLAMFELEGKLAGDEVVYIARPLLIEVFKNIFGNYRDHKNEHPDLTIQINSNDKQQTVVTINSHFDEGQSRIKPERMFEPFWTSSESGLGLGLFLTRELLNQIKGQIQFSQTQNTLCFQITLNKLDIPQL